MPTDKNIDHEIFPKEIQSLLRKKVFGTSNYLNSSKKPPKNPTNIKSTYGISKLSITKNFIFCIFLLTIYFTNIFKFKLKCSAKNLILVYSLTKDQAIRNRSVKSLNTFFESRGILDKFEAITLVEIRNFHWPRQYKNLKTTFDIPFSIYSNHFSLKSRLKCWLAMCQRFQSCIKLQKELPQISLIMKNFIFDDVVYSTVGSNRIKKLITSQTHLAYQPLVFEYENIGAKRLMIWYSSNSIPIQYKKADLKRFEMNPVVYNSMCIDEHWVWTKEHKNYLARFTQAKILVKQSLLFYEIEKDINSNENYDVLIFDVTPSKDSNIFNNSIYTTSEMIRFVSEILECVAVLNQSYQTNFKVYIKHKRQISKYHSSFYSKYIKSKVKNKELNSIGVHQNLYNLIKQSKLIIGFPFTSPVFIGQELDKPAIFYCSSKLLNTGKYTQKVSFLKNNSTLYDYMENTLVINK